MIKKIVPEMNQKMEYETFSEKKDLSLTPAILVGIDHCSEMGVLRKNSLEELTGLATTADYDPVYQLKQRLTRINSKTYIGRGKVDELLVAVRHHQAKVVIFDDNLSPGQSRNLETILKCSVMDRSWLILEIFNLHARTREAKTQVMVARLKYMLPRLTKMWSHLSRQRGGIGLKDAGEKQIQLDRRLIRDEISKLEKKLVQIRKEKETQRKSRQGVFRVALVGYTNVGKSTLMNCLTGSETLVENKLFATLDATVRKVKKNFPYPVLLTDTVGLIDKLPHDLVASFQSTLDEVRDADLLLIVADAGHEDFLRQVETTHEVLSGLGGHQGRSILVFNKIDCIEDQEKLHRLKLEFPQAVFVSCKKKVGLEEVRESIVQFYERRLLPLNILLEYQHYKLLPEIRKQALIVDENYEEKGLRLTLRLWPHQKEKIIDLLEQNGLGAFEKSQV